MSKRQLNGAGLTVVLCPTRSGIGRFEARLKGDDRLLCVSRTPFFDTARELVANGYDPNTDLILRHAGSDTDSLKAKLGIAASLTVEETDYGPKLRRWKPFPTLAVEPGITSYDPIGHSGTASHRGRAESSEKSCPGACWRT